MFAQFVLGFTTGAAAAMGIIAIGLSKPIMGLIVTGLAGALVIIAAELRIQWGRKSKPNA